MQPAFPEGVERQRGLVDAALGVEVGVRVGVVGPAGGHFLGAGRHAVVALDLALIRDRTVVIRYALRWKS
jgi:hypothetical protein